MTDENSFYLDRLPEGSGIEKLSNELKNFLITDVENLQAFLFKLFNNCYRFVFENTEPIIDVQRKRSIHLQSSNQNSKEAYSLIEDGFTFVTGEYADGGKIFRKPK